MSNHAAAPYFKGICGKCGAKRIDAQIGLEESPQHYVSRLVSVFREVRRVLRDDGTVWLNLGDSYASGGRNTYRSGASDNKGHLIQNDQPRPSTPSGLKPKDLVGIPWRVAFALQEDGWYLRSDIIWHKPNPMPESVTDRPTKAHEYLFLLSKSERYHYDAEAIKEQSITGDERRPYGSEGSWQLDGRPDEQRHGGKLRNGANSLRGQGAERDSENGPANRNGRDMATVGVGDTRNKRSVWTVATAPYPEAHFATYPPDLIKPCILAGCPSAGKRCDCDQIINTPTGSVQHDDPSLYTGRAGLNRPRSDSEGSRPITRAEQRWHANQLRQSPHRKEIQGLCGAAFDHYIRTDNAGARPLPEAIRVLLMEHGWITNAPPCSCPIQPAGTVLDPFGGSGTTGMVALELGRKAILIELNPDYVNLSESRCNVTYGLPLT